MKHHTYYTAAAIWIVIWMIHAGVFSVFFPLTISIVRSAANVAGMMLVYYVAIFLVDRYLEQRRHLVFGIFITLCILMAVVFRTQINLLFPSENLREIVITGDDVNNARFGALITSIGVALMAVLLRTRQLRAIQEKRHWELLSKEREAQLRLLRSQINPHFLFNNLNNIYSLAVAGSDKTAPMLLRLSQLLRYVTYETREALSPLISEIEHVQAYIELLRMSMEEPVPVGFSVEGQTNCRVEPAILLPIVENCFKHGDYHSNPKALIRFSLQVKAEGILHFVAENSFDPQHVQKDQIGGVGLENIIKRLQLRFGESARLQTATIRDIFRVELEMPTSA
jgi:sensor histidine kinase YesM